MNYCEIFGDHINSEYICQNEGRINSIISKIILSKYDPLKTFSNFENIMDIIANSPERWSDLGIIFVRLTPDNLNTGMILSCSDGFMSILPNEDLILTSNENVRFLKINKGKELRSVFFFSLMRMSHLTFSHNNFEIVCFFLENDILELMRPDVPYYPYPDPFTEGISVCLSNFYLSVFPDKNIEVNLAKKKILKFYKRRKENLKILERKRISKKFEEINFAIRYLPYIGVCRRKESKEIRRELKLLKS